MGVEPNGSTTETTFTFLPPGSTTIDPIELNKTKIAEEFYSTYDVMTGIRIAMTLGGFFAFMVILVLYKSKSETEKALEDPDFTAAAVAEVEEEEERQLAAVIEAELFQQLNPRKSRQSIDNAYLSKSWIRSSRRYSSIGSYSHLEPPLRLGLHSQLPSFDEDSTEDDPSIFDDADKMRHLDVPRRCSNITCSSSGSSYLERRDSAFLIGMPAIPAHKSRTRRRQSSPVPEIYDFYYPIDIRVIQPTPGCSPCDSAKTIYDQVREPQSKGKLAPLASISSCNSSLETEYPEVVPSYCASDSIFIENASCDDTDNEVEEFSTDSEVNDEQVACCSQQIDRSQTVTFVSFGTNTMKRNSKSSLTLVENPDEVKCEQIDYVDDGMVASCSKAENTWAQETLF